MYIKKIKFETKENIQVGDYKYFENEINFNFLNGHCQKHIKR